ARPEDSNAQSQPLERLATSKQRLQYEVAERQVTADQLAERGSRDGENGPGLSHDPGRAGGLSGEEIELDHQIARSLPGDLTRVLAGPDEDRHASLEHDHDLVGRVPFPEQNLAFGRRAHLSVALQQLDLLSRELRKQSRVAVVQQGRPSGRAACEI